MLKPSMQDLMNKVNNRYLLVNLVAQRARDIMVEAEEEEGMMPEKPVKQAIDEIAEGQIVYREGPKPEPVAPVYEALSAMEMSSSEEHAEEDEDIVMAEESEAAEAADDILEEL